MSSLGNKKIMSQNIQYYMNKHNKSRTEMCDALGVKYTTFTDWVKGNTYPRIDKIELMSNYFGISKSDLVEDHSKKFDDNSDQLNADLNKIAEKISKHFFNKKDLYSDNLQTKKNFIEFYNLLLENNSDRSYRLMRYILKLNKLTNEQKNIIYGMIDNMVPPKSDDVNISLLAAHEDDNSSETDRQNDIEILKKHIRNNEQ